MNPNNVNNPRDYGRYYTDFRKTVKQLEALVKALEKTSDLSALNKQEREAQKALFYIQHTALGLGYWVQGVASARRRELRDESIAGIRDPAHLAQGEKSKNGTSKSVKGRKRS